MGLFDTGKAVFRNGKIGAYQSVHAISKLATSEITIFYLVFAHMEVCSSMTMSDTPKTGFLAMRLVILLIDTAEVSCKIRICLIDTNNKIFNVAFLLL